MKDNLTRFTIAIVLGGAIFCAAAWGLYEFVNNTIGAISP